MVPRPRTTVLFYIFYLPPWRKNISFTFFIFRHGGRTFLLHFLSSTVAEERFFYVFYLPPWRKNIPFTFFIFRHGGRTSFFYFTIFRHGGQAFFLILLSSEASETQFFLCLLHRTPILNSRIYHIIPRSSLHFPNSS